MRGREGEMVAREEEEWAGADATLSTCKRRKGGTEEVGRVEREKGLVRQAGRKGRRCR